jgi:hypothetical protein
MSQTMSEIIAPSESLCGGPVLRESKSTGVLELPAPKQLHQLQLCAIERRWGLSLILVGWLHLVAFAMCYYLTIGLQYHGATWYLVIWVSELLMIWGIFRCCGGARPPSLAVGPLERLIRRIWTAYFILAFNLGSLNTLRGHEMFEFFPAMASLASFAFLMMAVLIDWRFSGAVVVLFASGLLMASNLWHAYLIFAIAWWLVLNVVGMRLSRQSRR